MADSLVVYETREPHIAIIRLNRPEKKNAMSQALQLALDEAWQQAKADDDVWSIILTGTGDSWCAGGDLGENRARARGELQSTSLGRGYSNLHALEMNKPIIAAINGYAVGGGFGLALACDIRYCVPAAKFGASEVRWSHMAAWPSYVTTIPLGWAFWFALTGQMVDAETAFRVGLVQKVCEPDRLLDDALELCATINANGKLIAQHTKEYIYKMLHEVQGWDAGNKLHGQYYAHLRQSRDYDEGTTAFLEKRRPQFSSEYYTPEDKPAGVPEPRS